MNRIITMFKKVGIRDVLKTLIFNFRYFPIHLAIRLPVLLSHRVEVRNMARNRIMLDEVGGGIFGILRFGLIDLEYCYNKPSMINIQGTIRIKGTGGHSFAPGAIVYVGKNAILTLNERFSVSHDVKIYCKHKITVGKDNMWSYYNVVMDNDAHYIYDNAGSHVNPNEEVVFGDNVWMGCRCTVMKGCYVPDGSVIGACSIVRRKLVSKDAIYAGLGPKIVRENIKWSRKLV